MCRQRYKFRRRPLVVFVGRFALDGHECAADFVSREGAGLRRFQQMQKGIVFAQHGAERDVSDVGGIRHARRIDTGGNLYFAPYVIGPSQIPEIANEARARENPELAVLSVMAHGNRADSERAVEIALAAQSASVSLDADRKKIYLDLILSSLGEAAREALSKMNARTYEYQSDFARHYIAQGRAEGCATLILSLLTSRFGPIGVEIADRVTQLPISELSKVGERLLSARSLEEALQ